jgi:hypothetical protein
MNSYTSGDACNVALQKPKNLSIFCESNDPIRLEWSSDDLANTAKTTLKEKRSSFYKYRATFSGQLLKGKFDITCTRNGNETKLYSWKFSVGKGKKLTPKCHGYSKFVLSCILVINFAISVDFQEPGIKFNQSDLDYPFTCYAESATTEPEIYNIQCDDLINCQIARDFSFLASSFQYTYYRRPNFLFFFRISKLVTGEINPESY